VEEEVKGNVFEKLNKVAEEKDRRIREAYEESKKWRELKDCTFKPHINRDPFKEKRRSNSARAFYHNETVVDPYYSKLETYLPDE